MFPQLTEELTKQRVEYTVVPHARTRSARAEAAGRGRDGTRGGEDDRRRHRGDRVIIDKGLAREDEVVLEAGTHDRSIKLHLQDLLALSGAEVANLAAD